MLSGVVHCPAVLKRKWVPGCPHGSKAPVSDSRESATLPFTAILNLYSSRFFSLRGNLPLSPLSSLTHPHGAALSFCARLQVERGRCESCARGHVRVEGRKGRRCSLSGAACQSLIVPIIANHCNKSFVFTKKQHIFSIQVDSVSGRFYCS